MSVAYLGLGSNLGNKKENIREAVKRIGSLPFTSVDKLSSFYYGPATDGAGPDFVNAVLRIHTLLHPITLLIYLEEIERTMGRRSKGQYLPRVIDIDILLFDDASFDLPDLVIPHPRMRERDFVMVPLKELKDS